MKIYLIAGEASGDLHGAGLIRALHARLPGVELRGIGGDQMQAEGMELFWHFREQNYMGFVEIIRHLPAIARNFKRTRKDILSWKPDAVILIDYPAFNLRLVKFFKQQGIKVFYFISPQIWAWKTSRVYKVKKYVDRMVTILPFEKAFYQKFGVEVAYAGHPLKALVDAHKQPVTENEKPLIVLLPGSRRNEIRKMLPVMLEAAATFTKDYRVKIAMAPSVDAALYGPAQAYPDVELVSGQTYTLLNAAHAALVTSGTATLETALFGVPQVVLYKANPLSVWIARMLIKVKYISLVNLILNRPAVKELIQGEMTVENVRRDLQKILSGPSRERQLHDIHELRALLDEGNVYEKAVAVFLESPVTSH